VTNKIQLFGGDYEHVQGLSGTYNEVNIEYVNRPLLEIFEGMLANRSYPACEFSLANYIMLKDRGAEWLSAIPIFPYRAFRHSTLYVRKDSDISEPSKLKGKRVGVPDYSMTAAVWTRGILNQQYGVHPSEITWTTGAKQRFKTLKGIDLTLTDDDLEDMLIAGKLDALLTPDLRDPLKPQEARVLRPLIANPQEAEEEYLALTGFYPINHVVVIREDFLKSINGVGAAIVQAYMEAKAAAYKRRLGTTLLPWGQRYWTRMFDRFGGDPLPYGLSEINRKIVGTVGQFLFEQKLIGNLPDVDPLFLAETRDIIS
jgi:4,5-dihydroxyphthalate decarboxylase